MRERLHWLVIAALALTAGCPEDTTTSGDGGTMTDGKVSTDGSTDGEQMVDGSDDAATDAATDAMTMTDGQVTNPCDSLSCGSHGTCVVADMTASCECDAGWDGAACDTCATGYAGGSCDACDTGFYGATCAACPSCVNGTCDDGMSGSGECNCANGWDGALCNTCAPGFAGGSCDQCAAGFYGASCTACASSCGDHGACDDGISGTGACMCDTGWNAATSCSSCASGFKGTACDECKSNRYGPNCLVCPLSCGAHGSCDQGITGSGGCNCDDHWTGTTCTQCATGYTGADCNTCAAGYQDNDTNGSCTPTCATAACESGTCIDLSGTATCLDPADYASCAALLSAFPGAPSGPYAIDPDGEGGNDALNVNCDMVTDGGGWTQVSIEDFSSGTATGWTNNTVDSSSTCATVYGPMLGGFGNFAGTSVTKTYNLGGVPHTEVSASLTYYVIDSWDGETASVTLGGSSIFSQTFNHLSASVNTCGGGWPEFGAQAVSGTIAHNAATVDLVAGSTLNQAASDESWGISDIVISVR